MNDFREVVTWWMLHASYVLQVVFKDLGVLANEMSFRCVLLSSKMGSPSAVAAQDAQRGQGAARARPCHWVPFLHVQMAA